MRAERRADPSGRTLGTRPWVRGQGVRMSKPPIDRVLDCPSLPTLPTVAVEVLELSRQDNVGMAEMARVVQRDPALSAKVLKTINSSFYGLAQPCGSIERAMAYLGMNAVKSLVLGFSLIESVDSVGQEHDLTAHWRRAIFSAAAAKVLGERVGEIDADEAFSVSLFQDIGAIGCLVAFGDRYARLLEGIDHEGHCAVERAGLEFDHAEVGGELCKRWKLPESIVAGVRWHHQPDRAPGKHRQLVRLVALARVCAQALDAEDIAAALVQPREDAQRWFGAGLSIDACLEKIADSSRTLAKLFGQSPGVRPDLQNIRQQATEQSLEHQLGLQREAERMARQAYTDALTGAANRKRFDEELARMVASCRSDGHPMALLFLDADKFKTLNDTHGHAAGDAVLVGLAQRAAEVVGERGLVCRYGGEEFAILLPNCGRDDAEAIAERLRAAVHASPFDVSEAGCDARELPVTVSIGVSATDCGDPARIDEPARLTHEADKAVYAAKESGRNAVRVWGRLRNSDDLDAAADQAARPEVAVAPAAGEGTPVRIWLVEDDALAAVLLRTMLKQRRGVDVEWLRTFEGSLSRIADTASGAKPAPDVIVSDHTLDGATGLDLLRMVRATPGMRDVPFIVITACSDPEVQAQYQRAKATSFVTKERMAREMNSWITAIVDAHPATRAAA